MVDSGSEFRIQEDMEESERSELGEAELKVIGSEGDEEGQVGSGSGTIGLGIVKQYQNNESGLDSDKSYIKKAKKMLLLGKSKIRFPDTN